MENNAKIPDIPGATVLTPLEMNAVRFPGAHTPITAEMLEQTTPPDKK